MTHRLNNGSLILKGGGARRGFTLVELMTVVAVLGLLVGIAIPLYNKYTFDANTTEASQLLVVAYREQQMVAEAVRAKRYPGYTAPYTEVFETANVNIPTLSLRPKGNERFNLILGEQDGTLVGRKAFSDFPGMGGLPKRNDYGFPDPAVGTYLIGAEAVIDNRLHAMGINEVGHLIVHCDGWSGSAGPDAQVFIDTMGPAPNCTVP